MWFASTEERRFPLQVIVLGVACGLERFLSRLPQSGTGGPVCSGVGARRVSLAGPFQHQVSLGVHTWAGKPGNRSVPKCRAHQREAHGGGKTSRAPPETRSDHCQGGLLPSWAALLLEGGLLKRRCFDHVNGLRTTPKAAFGLLSKPRHFPWSHKYP